MGVEALVLPDTTPFGLVENGMIDRNFQEGLILIGACTQQRGSSLVKLRRPLDGFTELVLAPQHMNRRKPGCGDFRHRRMFSMGSSRWDRILIALLRSASSAQYRGSLHAACLRGTSAPPQPAPPSPQRCSHLVGGKRPVSVRAGRGPLLVGGRARGRTIGQMQASWLPGRSGSPATPRTRLHGGHAAHGSPASIPPLSHELTGSSTPRWAPLPFGLLGLQPADHRERPRSPPPALDRGGRSGHLHLGHASSRATLTPPSISTPCWPT